jgi:hypothetical protein
LGKFSKSAGWFETNQIFFPWTNLLILNQYDKKVGTFRFRLNFAKSEESRKRILSVQYVHNIAIFHLVRYALIENIIFAKSEAMNDKISGGCMTSAGLPRWARLFTAFFVLVNVVRFFAPNTYPL